MDIENKGTQNEKGRKKHVLIIWIKSSCLPSQQLILKKGRCCALSSITQNHIPKSQKQLRVKWEVIIRCSIIHWVSVNGIPPSQPSSYPQGDLETSNHDELSQECNCVDSSSLEPVSSINHIYQKSLWTIEGWNQWRCLKKKKEREREESIAYSIKSNPQSSPFI